MKKLNKLILATLSAFSLFFSISICASAAQIDMLSMIDNTIYASISGENATFFVAGYDSDGLLSDVFFADSSNGYIELEVTEAIDYKVFLWDRESLAPVSCPYSLIDGVAYALGSTDAVPPFEFAPYSFDQEDDVMIVSSVSETEIKGFKAGAEVSYALAEDVAILGLSDSMDDVVPGCVVLIGTNMKGDCAAVELLASIGLPVDPDVFENSFGVYAPADGSEKYKNIVGELYSKSNSAITTLYPEKVKYQAENNSTMCYRVGISLLDGTYIVSATGKAISTYPSIFEDTSQYHNYLYLRYDSESERVTQCVYYCDPKSLDFTDEDYPINPFSLEPIVIIK